MVKAYLRYELADTWGVITSRSDICHAKNGKCLFAASLERVAVWDVKQAVLLRTLDAPAAGVGKSRPVTCMAVSPVSEQLAVGYGDGSIRVWNTESWECECTLNGHTGAVTCLVYSENGSTLASGSQNTDIVIWDATSETGLFTLRGHKGQVTDLVFAAGYLMTTSKDEHVKVWDLESERCVQTVMCHAGELWSLTYNPGTSRLAVGGSDGELRIFKVEQQGTILSAMESVKRSTGDRVAKCRFVSSSEEVYVVCQGAGKVLDVWRVRSAKEAEKRRKKREKRKEEKKKADDKDIDQGVKAIDELELVETIRSKNKIVSFSVAPLLKSKKTLLQIVLATSNNLVEVWDVKKQGKESVKVSSIDGQGHRSDVRSIALSSDDALCVSTSNAGAKVWNPTKGICIGSIDSGYGLCSVFAPGNKHVIVGTKEGTLEILDIGSLSRIEVVDAHDGPVWSICLAPDGTGFVSGSADKTIKFWEWSLSEEDEDDPSHLSIDCSQTLTMTDDVLSVTFTPNGSLLLAALLDSTVKIYFADSLKFFLSLYGHKLPVLSMDVSSDSTLLVTGSADKNVKIWGLDYGDCHKSIFAHDDSVMSVGFVPGTHYFFTGGKDKLVKYWDADTFEHLLDLQGHHGEVWSLAVSSLGDFVLTGSHDRSIRRWEKTEEAFFVDEEKEKRLESLFEEDLEAADRRPLGEEEPPEDGASAAAGTKTLETVTAADDIVGALDMAAAEEERIQEARDAFRESDYAPNPLLMGLSPSDYVLRAIAKVRGSELEQALLLVPFMDALKLLQFCTTWLTQGSNIELLARVSILLCRIHLHQLMATPAARSTLLELRQVLQSRLMAVKDTWGYNAAAIEFLQRQAHAKRGYDLVEGQAATAAKLKTAKIQHDE